MKGVHDRDSPQRARAVPWMKAFLLPSSPFKSSCLPLRTCAGELGIQLFPLLLHLRPKQLEGRNRPFVSVWCVQRQGLYRFLLGDSGFFQMKVQTLILGDKILKGDYFSEGVG